jgi:proteasome accessory factor C
MARPEAGDRLRRLLAILPWLAERGRVPIREVADRFGMSPEEVVAELELAACCGLPPYTPDQLIELIVTDEEVEANLGGRLSRPLRFTAAEGFTVAASARAILAVPGADPDGALARALAKLEAALGRRAEVTVELDAPQLLDVVRRAIADRERLEITYYSASRDELTRRRIDPRAVFNAEGRWYANAWCHLAGGVRLFRVDRMEEAVPTGERFEAPAEPASRVGEAFSPGPDVDEVTLVLSPSARWVIETYPTRGVEELGDGRVRVVLAVGGHAWIERLLLRLGPDPQVLDPPELAGARRRAAAELLARYT